MTIDPVSASRRGFLGLAAATAASGAAAAAVGRGKETLSPVAGAKFYADGRVHPFAGNTIICHLPQQGLEARCFSALLDIYRAAPGLDFMRKIALLPPSSYHMTVFSGANDADRTPGLWPRGLAPDSTMAACDLFVAERLRGFALETELPTVMKVDPAEPPADDAPFKIRLVGADAGEERKLRRLRDRLSERLGIRAPGHDAYYFHISLGYLIQPFTPAEQAAFRRALAGWRAAVHAAAPLIRLGAPEYCTFKDMFAFDRLFYLG